MLLSVRVAQYKSLRDVKLELGPLRILIGPNASGKSNLIDTLRLLHEALTTDMESALSRRGGLESVLFQGQRWGNKFEIDLTYAPTLRDELEFAYHVQVSKDDRKGNEGRTGVREENLQGPLNDGKQAIYFSAHWGKALPVLSALRFDTGDTGVLGLKVVGFLQELPAVAELRRFIEGWQFLQVNLTKVREPQRDQRARQLAADGSNLGNVLRTLFTSDKPRLERILEDVRSVLAHVEALDFHVDRGQVLFLLRERGLEKALDPNALSDGTLRVLALVTALHTAPEHSLLCFEEPEHGLHPLLFQPLLALIREHCPEGGTRQVLMTTHSPDVVDAARPEEIVPVERGEHGETVLHKLDKKKLKKWLKEFRLGELWRMRQLGAVP